MPLRINNNIPSLNVQRMGHINTRNLKVRLERLSSGLRVNRAADDASGLSVSEGMRAEIGGMRQGARNAEQAINLVQTAEGALNEVSAMLIRMRELAVQSASDTVTDDNRESINAEFVQLMNEIDRIASVTSYNNTVLLSGYGNTVEGDAAVSTSLASTTTGVMSVQISGAAAGTYTFVDGTGDREITLGNGAVTQTINIGSALDTDTGGGVVATGSSVIANFDRLGIQLVLSGQKDASGLDPATDGYRDGDLSVGGNKTLVINSGTGGTFQVGQDHAAAHRIEINIKDMTASGSVMGLGSTTLATLGAAQNAIPALDIAVSQMARARGDLGAYQNRLEFSLKNAENEIENNQASESSIRDADIAEEVSQFTSAQILTQSTTAMLGQANVLPQNVLTLLQ